MQSSFSRSCEARPCCLSVEASRCLCVFTQQGSVSVQQLDLSDLASVRVAAAALGELGDINMLILNAGVMVSCPDVICDSRMSLFKIFSWAAETPTRETSAPFQPLQLTFFSLLMQGTPQSYTKQGFEMQIGTNHFGHFMLVHGLLPKLTAQVRAVAAVCTRDRLTVRHAAQHRSSCLLHQNSTVT